jgi:serine/threonine protein kinase
VDASADEGEQPSLAERAEQRPSPAARKKKRARKPRPDGSVPTSSDETAGFDSDDKLVAPAASGEAEPPSGAKADSDSDLAHARPGSADLTSSDTANTTSKKGKRPPSAATPQAPPPVQATEGVGKDDALFGLFAVKLGLCTEVAVEKALAKQQKAQAEGGERRTLARLLVEQGALTLATRDQVLAAIDPEVIPGYEVLGEAGRGGMGVVYRANQKSMDRVVALKVLSRRLGEDPTYVSKFLAEARAAGKLNHENVVAAIDAGAANGLHYFVMEFVSGRPVSDLLDKEGPLPWERAFEIAEHLARALHHAHQAGLVHRDVKPENVLLAKDGRVKLCDLGLAKPTAVAGEGRKSETTEGTPYYCSPEQATGRTDIDARSDVYSLGATLFHMLKGEPPFDGENARAILVKQVREPFPDLTKVLPAVPAGHRALLADMVVKDREKRLGAMRTFEERLAALRKAQAAAPTRPKRGGAATAVGIGAVVLVAGAAIGGLAVVKALGLGDPQPVTTASSPPVGPLPPVTPTEAEAPTETGPVPGRVTEVEPPTESRPVTPTSDPAMDALTDARAWRAKNRDDLDGARARFVKVVSDFPGSEASLSAQREVEAIDASIRKAGFEQFAELTTTVTDHVRANRYKDADDALTAFRTTWRSRRITGLDDQLANLRRVVEESADDRLTEVLKAVDQARTPETLDPAVAALEALSEQLPAALALKAKVRLDLLSKTRTDQAARAGLTGALAKRDAALLAGDLEGAAAALREARADPALAGVAAKLDEALAALATIEPVWRHFDAQVDAKLVKADGRLKLRTGEALRGKATTYDARAWRVEWKSTSVKDSQPVELRSVAAEDLLALALPAAEGRANARYFVARGVADVATAALDAYVAQGGTDEPALRLEIAMAALAAAEREATRLVLRMVDPATPRDEVVSLGKSVPQAVKATATWDARKDAVRDAYVNARAAQLLAAPDQLFKGKVVKARKGDGVTITYDFKRQEEAEDWAVDAAVDPRSKKVWQEGAILTQGKLAHIARFKGGELTVEVKATSSSTRFPNLNVILGDRGGWTGVLLGLGFGYGALDDVRIDPAAPRKPGYTVPLPANVCIVLGGPPRQDGQNLAAETQPAVSGRGLKFDAARAADGAVRLRLRGRQVFALPPVPGWDEVAGVAIAPFATEVQVEEVEIAGVLDPTWIDTRARAVATTEAAAFAPGAPKKP